MFGFTVLLVGVGGSTTGGRTSATGCGLTMYFMGSSVCPQMRDFGRTSKCKCGPVDAPVFPENAIRSPVETVAPPRKCDGFCKW
jgi:hypothetical protein